MMNAPKPSLRPLALLSLALLGGLPPGLSSQTFEDRSDVVLIEVPVNVTAKNGEPVRGLTAADFELYDEGKRQEVVSFEAVDLEQVVPAAATGAARRQAAAALPPVARRHFLLLFDLSFSSPISITRARHAAMSFVQNALHPTDLAAVAVFSLETGPRLIVTFTPDRAQLARAIDTLGVPQLLARGQMVDPLRFVVETPRVEGLSASGPDTGGSGAAALREMADAAVRDHLTAIANRMERSQKAYERSRITNWSRALGDMAGSLNAVSGRKQVIYFSEGFDGRLLFGRQPSPDDITASRDFANTARGNIWLVDTDDTFGNSGLQSDVGKMLEEFRRADCVVHAVDIAGLEAHTDAAGRATSVGQDALFYVAHETGGGLFEDANNLERQLSKMLDLSAVTYVLGFQPAELKRDGRYRRLTVKLKEPRGAQVSARAGYYSPRPFGDLDPLEKSLLASNAIATTAPFKDLDLDVLVAPFKETESTAYVPVIIEAGGPSLLVGQKQDKLNVEIYAYVTDEKGQMHDFFAQVVGLDLAISREAIARSGLKYYGHLSLTPGEYLVRVLVRNAETGRTGVEAVRLSIPAFGRREPAVLPPFFLDPPGRWVLVRERTGDQQASVVYPFTVKGEPYIPAAKPALEAGKSVDLCLVAYHLDGGAVEVDGRVLASNGDEVTGGRLELRERTITGMDGLDKLLLRFDPSGLKAGAYRLEVAVAHPGTETREVNSIDFSVLN